MTVLAFDRTPARRPARPTSRGVQAALTALAFVVSSLISLVHDATTQHVRCAEHGELIHGAERAATNDVSSHDGVVRDVPGAPIQQGHEHCLLTSAMRESRIVPRPPAIVAAPFAIGDLAVATHLIVAARSGGLYRTAPKTSPPA